MLACLVMFLSRAVKGTKLKDEAQKLLTKFPEVKTLRSVVHQRQAIADSPRQSATVWALPGRPAVESAREYDKVVFGNPSPPAMTQKKSRKSLDDALAREFVYGDDKSSESTQEPEGFETNTKPAFVEELKESDLMSRLQTTPKEPTVRFTVDLSESMHRRLSMLAAKTGRKKADIVRFLLDEGMKDVGE